MPKVLLLGYDPRQPSFRHRMQSLAAPLESAGWQVRIEKFPSGRYGLRTFERRELWRWADVVILHQIKLSGLEATLFAAFARQRVFDVDDAIYVRKPRKLGQPPDESIWRKRKFWATCRFADVVAVGNEVLAEVARVSARETSVLPTSIDVDSYRPTHAAPDAAPTIAWIGSPENLTYLEMIRPALARLTVRHPKLRMRVICSHFPDWRDVAVERIAWSSDTEAESLAGAHLGVMPLTDDAWARGKCAFKLLQYMAAALPCVASPVGANREAVIDGVTGFHATSDAEWEERLERLIVSAELRRAQGAKGLEHVRARYSMAGYREQYLALLGRLVRA